MKTYVNIINSDIAKLLILIGYLLFFSLACGLCAASFFVLTPQLSSQSNEIITNLPPRTITPSIPFPSQLNGLILFDDDFTNNENNWTPTDVKNASLTIKDGNLLLKSLYYENSAIAFCDKCESIEEPFYLQADFIPTTATNESFGIVFSARGNTRFYYLFLINAESKEYRLFHQGSNGWSRLLTGGSSEIKSFPLVNKIGIYANDDIVEFYINDKMVDSYSQTGEKFYFGRFGLYVNDAGFELGIDNLSIIKVEQ